MPRRFRIATIQFFMNRDINDGININGNKWQFDVASNLNEIGADTSSLI